ncbi:MAG: sigma-70 family RNA polymerase sigma factor [Pseudomonadota bacterium]
MSQAEAVTDSAAANAAFDAACSGWIEGMTGRDEDALTSLYNATLSRVYAVALRIVGDESLAEDVVTNVYHQAWNQASRYSPTRGRPITWLLTICRSRALDEYRRAAAAERRSDALRELGANATVATPGDLLDVMESKHAVHAVLETLSADDRQLVALAFFRGMTHTEISAQTAQPLGTVKSRLRRALKSLGSALPAEFHEATT